MHQFRFLVSKTLLVGGRSIRVKCIILSMLRLKSGTEVEVCDGQGAVAVAHLDKVTAKKISLVVLDEKTLLNLVSLVT